MLGAPRGGGGVGSGHTTRMLSFGVASLMLQRCGAVASFGFLWYRTTRERMMRLASVALMARGSGWIAMGSVEGDRVAGGASQITGTLLSVLGGVDAMVAGKFRL